MTLASSRVFFVAYLLFSFATAPVLAQDKSPPLAKIQSAKPRNVIFILADDHRYDALGFTGHPFLETPHLDAMAAGGVHLKNACVTTSLCSPSRASILTGQFMHNHRVVDNNDLAPPRTIFFPRYLQRAGYQTAFVGKWHMGGGSDEPRPGFDHWVSFRGQGHYYPPKNREWWLNVNGTRVPQQGYITDELTDYALDWLKDVKADKPFFLYLSHKAVHAEFDPAERHAGRYRDADIRPPANQANTAENYKGKPSWVKNQRNSWHGVDYPYHSRTDMTELYRRYCESVLAVDDSVGRVMQWLKENGLECETLVLYMGDNGFLWGEHGLIDKRNAYEESMRVPMIGHCPDLIKPGTVVDGVVANIDVAPTILEAAALSKSNDMDGESFLKLASGEMSEDDWRQYLLYEYYWEWNFPHTPTTFALRDTRYKLIQYHGVWDTDELYDLEVDPREMHNLIHEPAHRELVAKMRRRLYEILKETGGAAVPFGEKRGHGASLRSSEGSGPAEFPPEFIR